MLHMGGLLSRAEDSPHDGLGSFFAIVSKSSGMLAAVLADVSMKAILLPAANSRAVSVGTSRFSARSDDRVGIGSGAHHAK